MMRSLIFILALGLFTVIGAQNAAVNEPFSENGWYLSPNGKIRILVIYAEIEYDKVPSRDPQPNGAEHWKKGELPTWKDDVFDPHVLAVPKATVSRYYHDISLGHYQVLGDYVNELMVIKESEHRSIHNLSAVAIAELNKRDRLRTKHNLSIADFDYWKDSRRPGLPQEVGPDETHRYDHIMVIVRNSSLKHGQGSTDPGSSGKLFGYESDTQSRFGAMNGMPFGILKHEYNHLLLGGNNFHSGGGNAAQFDSYLLCQQGGWSMMGAVNSSILTTSAWDRYRLGWKAADSDFLIRARKQDGSSCNGDLNPMNGDTGIFVIKDFVTQGDAIRIKLPHIPEDEFQQWLWLENHQGHLRNSSPTDRYQWELNGDCVTPFGSGIYAMLQIDREKKRGADIYRGFADYLKALPANGNHDLRYTGEKYPKSCPFMSATPIFERNTGEENALTGFHEMELPIYNKDTDKILRRSEHYVPYVRYVDGKMDAQGAFNGRPEHAFTKNGTRKIGIGTNPSTANTLTLVRSNSRARFARNKPNNRVIYLNHIGIEIIEEGSDGSITVRITHNDNRVSEDLRWAADSIVLPPIATTDPSLIIESGKRLLLDRAITPTRNIDVETYQGQEYYNSASVLTISSGAEVKLEEGATLELAKASTLHLMPGATLNLGVKSRLEICADCTLVLHKDAKIILSEKCKVEQNGTTSDKGVQLFQMCKGELVTQGDKRALMGK